MNSDLDQRFSTSRLLTFKTRQFFVMRDSPVHCEIFRDMPGLYSLGSSNNAPSLDNEKCLLTLPNVPWDTKLHRVKNHCPTETQFHWRYRNDHKSHKIMVVGICCIWVSRPSHQKQFSDFFKGGGHFSFGCCLFGVMINVFWPFPRPPTGKTHPLNLGDGAPLPKMIPMSDKKRLRCMRILSPQEGQLSETVKEFPQ